MVLACSLPQGESQRDTGTRAEQTDFGFAPIERGVRPGQVATRQPDTDQPSERGEVFQRRAAGADRRGIPQG